MTVSRRSAPASTSARRRRTSTISTPGRTSSSRRGPTTSRRPQEWFADEAGLGQDGIIAKRAEQPYLRGARGWVKVKHRKTADCVVGGYRVAKNDDGVGSLLLGLYDDEGNLHYVGHTSSFKAKERRELREQLRPLEGEGGFGGDARARRSEPMVGGQGHRMGLAPPGARL